jgi:hypothetical protein
MSRLRPHYAWIVAAVAFVTLLLASGFRSTPGVLIDPLQMDLHWSRASIPLAIGVNLVLFGLTGPFAAAAMQRFGIRRVVVVALGLCALGSGLTVRMTEPWQLVLLWGVVVGLGTGCMASVFAATVANRWFVARRRFVTGVLTAASATGQLAFLPLRRRGGPEQLRDLLAGLHHRRVALRRTGSTRTVRRPLPPSETARPGGRRSRASGVKPTGNVPAKGSRRARHALRTRQTDGAARRISVGGGR